MFKQSFIPGFPEGAQRIGGALSILKQDARVIYFVGGEHYVDHKEGDKAGERFAFACLMENGHVRATDLQKPPLSLPQRTLMNWCAQYRKDGSTSFFRGRPLKKPPVMTEAMRAQCAGLLDQAINPSESDLQPQPMPRSPSPSSTKSARSQADAQAASGIGTACTRADERIEAAFGLATSASARFESVCDVPMAGLLAGLPALCANGLFSGLDKHLSLPKGFYSALHILLTPGFMALGRIRRHRLLGQRRDRAALLCRLQGRHRWHGRGLAQRASCHSCWAACPSSPHQKNSTAIPCCTVLSSCLTANAPTTN